MNGSSKFACIDGFGEELDEVIYGGASNWFISFRSPFTVYSAHFSYCFIFFVIIACGLLSFRHSLENGRKYTQFWSSALLHGIVSERGLTARRYWHAQAPIMFFGKQLPFHIVFLYPSILYVSMMAAHRLNLNMCTESLAVGLIAMLMEIPYRMISVKFLHVTYHDSDPLFYHKLCGVPWMEILSSLVMASSFVALYHGSLFYQTHDFSAAWDKTPPTRKEAITAAFCGLTGPIFGFLQKIILFHFLNDFFNVNVVSCWFLIVSLYVSFVVCFEPKKLQKCVVEDSTCKSFLFTQVALYLGSLLFLALLGKPQNEISIGTHEPIGDCTMLMISRTFLGKNVHSNGLNGRPEETHRKKFLCTKDICQRSHFLYNFDCVPKGAPSLNSVWYTICESLFFWRFVHSDIFLQNKLNLIKKIFQQPLKRKKYLCADEVSARTNFVFNFDCLEEGPPCLHATWYTICGSPICNRGQFIVDILSFIILLSTVFCKAMFCVTTQLDAAKGLILKLRGEIRRRPTDSAVVQAEEPTPPEEVTVGFVFIKNSPQVFLERNAHVKMKLH